MAEVGTYPALSASAIDRTADFLYVRDATGPSAKKANPQALFDSNLQGIHNLLGNLLLDGGGQRTMSFANMASFVATGPGAAINLNGAAQIVGPLQLFTPFIDAGSGLAVGAPLVLYDVNSGRADFGQTSESWVGVNVETITSGRTLANDDFGKTFYHTGSNNITLTVPAGLGPGFRVRVVQGSTGKVTMAGSGVTVNGKQGHLSTGGQWHVIEAARLSASVWIVWGDTAN